MRIAYLCLILYGLSLVFPQTPSKVLEWQPKSQRIDNPKWKDGTQSFPILDRVEIEQVAVGNRITIGQPFNAGTDWLKEIVIRVRNKSDVQIQSIQVDLVLPQMGLGSPDVVYCYGCAAEENAKGIAPGESVEVKMIAAEYYDFVKGRATEKGGISQITQARIREMFVTLPGGKMWVSGCIKTADPKDACPVD